MLLEDGALPNAETEEVLGSYRVNLHFDSVESVGVSTAFQVIECFELLANAVTNEYCATYPSGIDSIPETHVKLEATKQGSVIFPLVVDLAANVDPELWGQMLQSFLDAIGQIASEANRAMTSTAPGQIAINVIGGVGASALWSLLGSKRLKRDSLEKGNKVVFSGGNATITNGRTSESSEIQAGTAAMLTNEEAMRAVAKMVEMISSDVDVSGCAIEDSDGSPLVFCGEDGVMLESMPESMTYESKPMVVESSSIDIDEKDDSAYFSKKGRSKRRLSFNGDARKAFEEAARCRSCFVVETSGVQRKSGASYSYCNIEITDVLDDPQNG